ncbi:MAG: MFS transporter [Candidatus Limnocylindrales bacterium]|nr:MFS transporter [Candidatus Limnocylindrales bacterium]
MALPIARRATRVSLPLVGAFAVGAIAYGGLYTFPAISLAFADEFGISRTLAVTPWTMFLLVTALASPLLGRAYDEFADRDLLTASMVLLASGWLAVYLAGDISLVILAYAGLHAIGLQLAFIGTSTAIARRYAGMSGLALGIAYAGPGIGVAVALPVAAQLIETAGWRSTSLVFMAACLVGVAFVWLMTSGPAIVVPAPGARRPRSTTPPDRGAMGEPMSAGQSAIRAAESGLAARASGLHETAAPGAVSAAQEIPPTGSGEHRHSVRRTVRTRRFWILFAGAAAIGVFDEGILQAFVPGAVAGGMRAETAAAALGLQALAYVVGQVAGGWLSDRIGRRIVGLVAAIVVGGGVVAAIGLVAALPALAIAGVALHGVGTGATIAVRSAVFGDVFGGASFGTIFGLLAVAYPVGGTVAVYIGALAFDSTGSNLLLIPVVLGALAVWSVSLWVAGPRRSRPQPRVAGLRP